MTTVYTKQQRIAKLAGERPGMAFTTLAHHIDLDWLKEAFLQVRRDGAAGVDNQTWEEYAREWEGNLTGLLDRLKSGSYFAPPVRRVHIPKGDGSQTRPIGIPTIEDKTLQRAIVMLLEPIYEPQFKDWSFGFRPGRSAHDALAYLWEQANACRVKVILEVDIKAFFDTIPHGQLREVVGQRVRDGVVLRVIGKWLNAGVMEKGQISYSEEGTPQGGVISPLLANIYLHEVLDEWFATTVKPRLKGLAFMVRYADDFVMGFECQEDAQRVYEVLPKRLAKYGLSHHPEKTRKVDFARPGTTRNGPKKPADEQPPKDDDPHGGHPGRFDFLGFTHYWGRALSGGYVIKRKTSKQRLNRAIKRVGQWCCEHRHLPMLEQCQRLKSKLNGHYNYYGITGNGASLSSFAYAVKRLWHKWLNRRDRSGSLLWERFAAMLQGAYRLPSPRIVHSVYAAKQ
jgi:RNA-directed DNA polymerase